MRVVCFVVGGGKQFSDAGASGDLYWSMVENAISMIRRHNSRISLRIFFCGQPSEKIKNFCSEHGVDLRVRPSVSDDYFCKNRLYLSECEEESVLHLDSDVFVFGDIETFFDKYADADFVACPNKWVYSFGWDRTYIPELETPFNSGVTLFNGGLAKKWSGELGAMCDGLAQGEPQVVAEWLLRDRGDEFNFIKVREEFALSLYIARSGCRFRYFDRSDCRHIEHLSDLDTMADSVLFHSFSPYWQRAIKRVDG